MALNQTIRESCEKVATEPLEETPHACMDGWVFLGFEGEDENGEHVELVERVACRRCRLENPYGGSGMRIELESVEPRYRSEHPVKCFVCGGKFVPENALAALRGDEGTVCGDVCPRCLAAGPEAMRERLERALWWAWRIMEDYEELLGEDLEAPTLTEYRLMDRIAALD